MKLCEYQFHISDHQAFERSHIHKLEVDGGLISFSFFFMLAFNFWEFLRKESLSLLSLFER